MKEILKFCTTMVYTLLHHLAWHHLMSLLPRKLRKLNMPRCSVPVSPWHIYAMLWCNSPWCVPKFARSKQNWNPLTNLEKTSPWAIHFMPKNWHRLALIQVSDFRPDFAFSFTHLSAMKVLEFQAKLNFSKSCCTTSIDKSCYIPSLTTNQQVIRPITEAPFESLPKKTTQYQCQSTYAKSIGRSLLETFISCFVTSWWLVISASALPNKVQKFPLKWFHMVSSLRGHLASFVFLHLFT